MSRLVDGDSGPAVPADDVPPGWAEGLPDRERAEVIKAHISEAGATRRAQIEADKQVKVDPQGREGHYFVRSMFALVLALLDLGGTCVGYHGIALRQSQVDLAAAQLAASQRPPPPPAVPLKLAPAADAGL